MPSASVATTSPGPLGPSSPYHTTSPGLRAKSGSSGGGAAAPASTGSGPRRPLDDPEPALATGAFLGLNGPPPLRARDAGMGILRTMPPRNTFFSMDEPGALG